MTRRVPCSCKDPNCMSHNLRGCDQPADYDVRVFDSDGNMTHTTSVCHSCFTKDMEQIMEPTNVHR